MKKFDGVLLCSDFDGTLFNNEKKEISKENAEAIHYFQENGGYFTLATGRYPNILEEYSQFTREVKANAPIIAANGCLVYDIKNNTTLYEARLDNTEKLVSLLLELSSSFEEFTHAQFCVDTWISKKILRTDTTALIEQAMTLPYKIWFALDLDRNSPDALSKSNELSKKFSNIVGNEYQVFRGSVGGIEILPLGVSKGCYVRKLADILGCDTLVCVGDYENDATMIKEADIGYAMGNAHPSLFEIADRIAPRVEDNAIAKIIYEL